MILPHPAALCAALGPLALAAGWMVGWALVEQRLPAAEAQRDAATGQAV